MDKVMLEKRIIQLCFALHDWEIHANQGYYHDWHDSFGDEIITGKKFASRSAPKYQRNLKHGKTESYR